MIREGRAIAHLQIDNITIDDALNVKCTLHVNMHMVPNKEEPKILNFERGCCFCSHFLSYYQKEIETCIQKSISYIIMHRSKQDD